MSEPSYRTDESPDKLWLERAVNAAQILGSMGYGIHLAVYATAAYLILHQRKIQWRWLVYNTLLLIFGTIGLACIINFNQLAWIDERNYPGGPARFLTHENYRPVSLLGTNARAIVLYLSDGLLLYRVWVIWDRWYVIILPLLLYLANMAVTTANIIESAHPYNGTWGPNLGLICWVMTMTLNILLTLMLAGRLYYMRRKLQSMISGDYAKVYSSVASMVIEAAIPMAVVSMIFLILFAKKATAESALPALINQIECISPQLIIIRVIRGKAWSRDTMNAGAISTLRFGAGAGTSSETPSLSDGSAAEKRTATVVQVSEEES